MSNLSPEHMTARLLVPEQKLHLYWCPICRGRRKLQVDFCAQIGLSTSTNPVTCKACDGWGVIVA